MSTAQYIKQEYDHDEEELDETMGDHEHSDPEEAVEEEEEEEEEEQVVEEDLPSVYAVGRNGRTKWYPTQPHKRHKIQKTHYPGVQAIAKQAFSALECWKLFFDNNLLDEIVRCTNKFIVFNRDENKKDLEEKYTDVAELKALCGLLYMLGLYGSNYVIPSDMWRSDGTGVEIFPLTMSFTRFQFLLRSLSFDDIKTRQQKKEEDKLSQVRHLIELFTQNCQKSFSISDLICVKETYEQFRGKCSFKQLLPNSTKKYGIKIFTALDAIMFYVVNFEIEVPNQVPGPFKYETNEAFLMKLCTPLLNEERTVICDQPYCTPSLATSLLENQTYLVGRWNRHDEVVPKEFSSSKAWKGRKKTKVAYSDDITLVATLKKKSSDITISTRPQEDPRELNTFVNTVNDMVRRVLDSHSQDCINISKSAPRWPLLVFYHTLNIAITNSLIVSRCNDVDVASRRDFTRELAMKLINEHLKARLLCDSVPLAIKTKIAHLTKSQIPTLAYELSMTSRHRCQECPSKKNRKTTNVCKQCRKFLCIEHLVKVCSTCFDQ